MNYKNMDKKTLIKILKQKDKILKKKNKLLKKATLEKRILNYYASIDPLTNVLNRRAGLKHLKKEFNSSKIDGYNLVVCYADIDKFKMINDCFGHKEGDKVLKKVGKILKENIRKTDFVIRMGGDEFLLVFPRTTMREAIKVLHRICVEVETVSKGSNNYNLSLSYGVYEYSGEMQKQMSIWNLIDKSDREMYKNKL